MPRKKRVRKTEPPPRTSSRHRKSPGEKVSANRERDHRHAPVELPRDVRAEIHAIAGGRAKRAESLLSLAVGAFEEGDLPAAIRLGKAAKAIANRSAAVREFLGVAYYLEEDWNKALSELRAARRMSGSDAQVSTMADCLRAMGRSEEALNLLADADTASLARDERVEAALVEAGIRRDRGDLASAVRVLRAVLEEPENVEEIDLRLWYLLADLFEEAGRDEEARRLFAKIAEHDPRFGDAANRSRFPVAHEQPSNTDATSVSRPSNRN